MKKLFESIKNKVRNSLGEEIEQPITVALLFVGSALLLNKLLPSVVVHKIDIRVK